MKFTLITLAGALASTNASRQLRSTPRLLENNNNNNNADAANTYLALDSSAIITFAKCIDVKTQLNEDADENLQALLQAGTAAIEQSYAAFYTNSYLSDSDMYLIDLPTYINAKLKAAEMTSDEYFCQQCDDSQGYCEEQANAANQDDAANAEAADGEDADGEAADGEAADGEGEGRKLQDYIDCGTCYSKGCFDENDNNNGQSNQKQMLEFLKQASECMDVNYQDGNGIQYYIGLSCGSYGDAAEFAVYVDEDCSAQINTISASSLLTTSSYVNGQGTAGSTLMTYASVFLQEAFTTSQSCYAKYYLDAEDANDANANNDNNEDMNLSEACNEFKNAVLISSCAANQQEQEEADDEDQYYDFDVQDGEDIDEVCSVINAKLSKGEEFQYFYNEGSQGTVYERDNKGHLKTTASKSGLSGGVIFLIVFLVIAIVVAPVAWLIKTKRNTTASETDYHGGTLS